MFNSQEMAVMAQKARNNPFLQPKRSEPPKPVSPFKAGGQGKSQQKASFQTNLDTLEEFDKHVVLNPNKDEKLDRFSILKVDLKGSSSTHTKKKNSQATLYQTNQEYSTFGFPDSAFNSLVTGRGDW